jgi:DNA-binding GntR family transcriptional regulator
LYSRNTVKLETSEMIAQRKLKELILAGELPMNEFLSQRMLAERIDASIVSLRAALRYLESEGLIESVPRWGVRIPAETPESLQDRYFVREVIEVAAVRRMLERKATGCREILLAKADVCDRMAKEKPDKAVRFAEVHFDFHHALAECSGSKLLVDCIDRLSLRTLMFWNAQRGWAHGLSRIQHVRLVEDLFGEGVESAEQAIRDHVRQGLEYELQAPDGRPDTAEAHSPDRSRS